jgi:hypothetical protein
MSDTKVGADAQPATREDKAADYEFALRMIAGLDEVEAALDPDWAIRTARHALKRHGIKKWLKP